MTRPCAFIVALALAVPARASEPVAAAPVEAPPGAYDSVTLRDGSLLRGTIVELAPGKSVVIAVPGVGTRTIAWAEVASTAFAGDPSGRSASGPEGPVPEDREPAPGPSRPRITIELSRPGEVHLLEAGWPVQAGYRPSRSIYSAARSVCRAPCERVIDGSAGNPFFFGGSRTVPSRIFYLKDLEGDYVARVKPGRVGMLLGGAALLGLGYAGTLGGGLVVGLSRDEEPRLVGGIVLGAGLALLAASIAMIVRGTTRYTLRRR